MLYNDQVCILNFDTKEAMRSTVLLFILLLAFELKTINALINDTFWGGYTQSCSSEDRNSKTSMSCSGIKIVRKMVHQFLEDSRRKKSWEVMDGVTLISVDDEELEERTGRRLSNIGEMNAILKVLENRELRIRLENLFPENFQTALKESLPSINQGLD